MTPRHALRNGRLARLARAREGAAAVEFALVAPVFLLLIMGIYDLGQMVYGRVQLQGMVQDAARSSSLETADTSEADAKVEREVVRVLPGATVQGKRVSYFDFNDVGRPEKWNDANDDDTCNNGESYVDENRNGAWDADVGRDNNGGAGDVVLYTVTVTYKPLFPVPMTANSQGERTIVATTVKKNQPFALQQEYGSSAGKCT